MIRSSKESESRGGGDGGEVNWWVDLIFNGELIEN